MNVSSSQLFQKGTVPIYLSGPLLIVKEYCDRFFSMLVKVFLKEKFLKEEKRKLENQIYTYRYICIYVIFILIITARLPFEEYSSFFFELMKKVFLISALLRYN